MTDLWKLGQMLMDQGRRIERMSLIQVANRILSDKFPFKLIIAIAINVTVYIQIIQMTTDLHNPFSTLNTSPP